jgi:hypothetical protein
MRAFAGEHDRDFTMARVAEVRTLLDAAGEVGDAVVLQPIGTEEGYEGRAEFCDQPCNQLIASGEFHEARLHDLPLPDDHVDARRLRGARPRARPSRQLVRVLRPGAS